VSLHQAAFRCGSADAEDFDAKMCEAEIVEGLTR